LPEGGQFRRFPRSVPQAAGAMAPGAAFMAAKGREDGGNKAFSLK
jgi:hypothetical protein